MSGTNREMSTADHREKKTRTKWETILTTVSEGRADDNELRNLASAGASATLIHSISICTFIVHEGLKYVSILRPHRQSDQFCVYLSHALYVRLLEDRPTHGKGEWNLEVQ